MATLKKPYEISLWTEKLIKNGKKLEEKGLIIGAHDMNYLGRATNVVLRKLINGTNVLSFDMPDSFFDSLRGDFVRNEFIDELFSERKLKLFYDGDWYEFFIKKINEKEVFKTVVKSFTCYDAFIDELSRNGYGITFDEELYNNVEEAGTFTEIVLEDSIWEYHPELNWGDFSEFQEEKLYRIPISQFGGTISGYKLWFELTNNQRDYLNIKTIKNVYSKEERNVEMSDDAARTVFWDQQNLNNPNGDSENPLASHFVENIENDGFIYVPYSCLNFCYGSTTNPDETLKYDRAATEIALSVDGKLVLSPNSIDPRTIIQFIVIPKNAKVEVDDGGVILNKGYHYFMTLRQWNELVQNKTWYFFEDTRLVGAETLGSSDLEGAQISHTFRYLYEDNDNNVLNSYKEFWGNKTVFYSGYLSDINNTHIIMGRKYSITNRTEINVSEEIDQYTTVYNNSPDEYKNDNENLFTSQDWNYEVGDNKYRVCSKLETRQVIPQLARNLVQNGTNIQSTDGWAPMHYLETDLDNAIYSSALKLRTTNAQSAAESISGTVIQYAPPYKKLAYIWKNKTDENNLVYSIGQNFYSFNGDTSNPVLTSIEIKKSDYEQKRNEDNSPISLDVYPHIEAGGDIISWTIDNKVYSTQLTNEDYSFINFGIIGQEKEIEKDRIYCIGIEAISQSNFSILIGDGSLVSTGNYNLSDTYIKFNDTAFYSSSEIPEFDWSSLNNDDTNLIIKDDIIPKKYLLFRSPITMKKPYFIIQTKEQLLIKGVEFFEAYTKGYDSFVEEEAPYYKYSGRDLFGTEQPIGQENIQWIEKVVEDDKEIPYSYSFSFKEEDIRKRIIFEDSIMLGSTYGYQKYYIQRLRTLPFNDNPEQFYDTCGAKQFIIADKETEEGKLPLDAAIYSEDNYVVETNYINMNKCKYYLPTAGAHTCDCSYEPNKICFYQKYGYCPYRFETEKHCRKIRTLKVSKSNRFNILQEISKVFQFYPQFYINHKENGRVIKNSNNEYEKQFFFITEKGVENKIGFRYEKNLKSVSRDITSEQIVSKLYVEDVDSSLSNTGLCSIKSAEDNPSKDSFIIDLSYYVERGILDEDEVNQDLYGISPIITTSIDTINDLSQGFLRQLGYYNTRYDEISNKIINLQDASYNELEANLNVNLTGITTAQEQLLKIKQQMERFKNISSSSGSESQSYQNYVSKYTEQEAILSQLITITFFSNGTAAKQGNLYKEEYGIAKQPTEDEMGDPIKWFGCITDYDKMKENWVDLHLYTTGILGQYNKEYNQIQAWKKERASYLKLINRISSAFYRKYEPYLKEGTWSDSNFLTDNSYYFGALNVAAEGCRPKVSYNFSVIDLGVYEKYKDVYNLEIANTTFVEDASMFGYNQKTGLPNRIKVLISEIAYNLDDMSKVDLKVQNYTTQFSDLFEQITATVQSLTYNENVYKRASNFTALQSIETTSLQGALDNNNLTLLNTDEQNIQMDNTGTRGSDINNHANKYKQDGQGIFFSNDGGQHWSVGVGPGGINADYIKVGSLDASKIKIIDGGYIYFGWDKDGIISYRDPQGINTNATNINDFVSFNKYGLSLVENNKIRLRAGYNFNGSSANIGTEKEVGDNVGFYLYNSNGKEIFATNTDSILNDKSADTARIKLIGEMLVSDLASIEEKSYTYTYKNRYEEIESGRAYIGEDSETFTYNEATDSYLQEDIGIKVVNDNNFNNTSYDIYRVIITDDENNQGAKLYAMTTPPQDGNDNQGIIVDGSVVEYHLLNKISDETFKTSGLYDNLITNNPYYYDNNKHMNNVYQVDNNYYSTYSVEEKEYAGESAAIILNNKQDFKENSEAATEKQRLICIAKRQEKTVNNILTVLKDGSFYIGGQVQDANGKNIEKSLSELPDTITINNSNISITPNKNGKMIIDATNVSFKVGKNEISLSDILKKIIKN